MEIKIYNCSASNEPSFKAELLKCGASFPEIYFDKNALVDIIEKTGSKFITLPLCNTLSAEALGAKVSLGNNEIDSFVETHIYNNLDEFIFDKTKFESDRIDVMLEAIKELNNRSYTVSFNLDGPITILGSLIDPMKIFKAFKKEPEQLKKIMDYLSELIIELGRSAIDSGASILSYSDSSGTLDLIGPKYYNEFCLKPNLNIIKALGEYTKDKKAMVHICGKSTAGLYSSGAIELIPHEFKDSTYEEALMTILGKNNFNILGNYCLGMLNRKPFRGYVYEMSIKNK